MGAITVFHVDDDIDYLGLVTFRLLRIAKDTKVDIDIYTFNSYGQLIDFINRRPEICCDIFITDYELGNIDGITIINNVKGFFPNAICILLSSKGNTELVKQLIEAEVDFYFHKSAPINFLAYELKNIIKLVGKIKVLKEEILAIQDKKSQN